MKHEITLELVTVTKGAVRYAELDSNGKIAQMTEPSTVIGTVYLRKPALARATNPGGAYPQKLKLTVETF